MQRTSGKYSVVVSGGHANVGHRAKMSFHKGHRRGYATHISSRRTSKITGPGQALKDIPSSVLSEVVECLNIPSPLGNNWKAVAAEMAVSYLTVMSLDHHGPKGMMEGVLEIMFEKKLTVGYLVGLLQKIQRPDVIEIFIKAGFPRTDSIRVIESDIEDFHYRNNSVQVVTIATPNSSLRTSSACASDKLNNGSIKDSSYNNKNVSEENSVTTVNCGHISAIICEEVVGTRGSNSVGPDKEEISVDEHSPVCSIIDRIASFMTSFRS